MFFVKYGQNIYIYFGFKCIIIYGEVYDKKKE